MTCRWLADALQMTCRRLAEMTCKWLANDLQINDLHNRTWICLANCVLWLANMTYKHCRISHTHGHGFLKSCFSFFSIDSGVVFQSLILLEEHCCQNQPQIFHISNLDWLWKVLKHRDSSIRIMGYQITSILATSDPGFEQNCLQM